MENFGVSLKKYGRYCPGEDTVCRYVVQLIDSMERMRLVCSSAEEGCPMTTRQNQGFEVFGDRGGDSELVEDELVIKIFRSNQGVCLRQKRGVWVCVLNVEAVIGCEDGWQT